MERKLKPSDIPFYWVDNQISPRQAERIVKQENLEIDILQDYLDDNESSWFSPISPLYGITFVNLEPLEDRGDMEWYTIQAEGTSRDFDKYWEEKMKRKKDGIA